MKDFLEKLNEIQNILNLILENMDTEKGGPGSGPRPSGAITDPNGLGPIRVPGAAKPHTNTDRIVVTPGKPVRLR